jgi:uncharacterized protein YjlB
LGGWKNYVMKNSNDITRSRTRDIAAYTAVLQPTAPPRANKYVNKKYGMNLWRRMLFRYHCYLGENDSIAAPCKDGVVWTTICFGEYLVYSSAMIKIDIMV